MEVAIVGIGALGSLLGAYLGATSNVVLLGHWPEHVQAIRAHGLLLEKPEGGAVSRALRVETDAARIEPVDIVLVATKSRQTQTAAATAAQILKREGLAVTLQNGLNNLSQLRSSLGIDRSTLGVTSEGATLLAPGIVRHAGRGRTSIALDGWLGSPQSRLATSLVDCLNAVGLTADLIDNADSLVWGKLVVNAVINPLTALLQVPNGALLEDNALIALMGRVASEVVAVAAAQGIALPFPEPLDQALSVARRTAANQSSMLQDILRGVPTEIDVINGAVVRAGRELGVATPMNERLLTLVKLVEESGRPLIAEADSAALLMLVDIETHEDASHTHAR